MTLSHAARALAAEIAAQDWSDAHTRADGSRHDRKVDRTSAEQLTERQADIVKMNVVWVVGQGLREIEPDFDIREFATAAGVAHDFLYTRRGTSNGVIEAGLRPPRDDIELIPEGRHWVARLKNSYPDGRVSVVVGATPQDALQALLDADAS